LYYHLLFNLLHFLAIGKLNASYFTFAELKVQTASSPISLLLLLGYGVMVVWINCSFLKKISFKIIFTPLHLEHLVILVINFHIYVYIIIIYNKLNYLFIFEYLQTQFVKLKILLFYQLIILFFDSLAYIELFKVCFVVSIDLCVLALNIAFVNFIICFLSQFTILYNSCIFLLTSGLSFCFSLLIYYSFYIWTLPNFILSLNLSSFLLFY